jgi:hypothetical protein
MTAKKIITLRYRKIIGIDNNNAWDRLVFTDSYKEFKMQSQLYNQEKKYHTFGELIHFAPGAEKLHFLVSGAITNYLKQLGEVIPDVTNNLGLHFLKFKHFRFELINSDLQDIEKHLVALNFYSEELYFLEQFGPYLLTSKVDAAPLKEGEEEFTDLFTIPPYLTIHSIK